MMAVASSVYALAVLHFQFVDEYLVVFRSVGTIAGSLGVPGLI